MGELSFNYSENSTLPLSTNTGYNTSHKSDGLKIIIEILLLT